MYAIRSYDANGCFDILHWRAFREEESDAERRADLARNNFV